MIGRETRDKEEYDEARHCRKARPMHDQLEQVAEPEASQGKQASAQMSVAEQASLVKSPRVFSAQRAEAMLELQQTHGNRYVQRLAEEAKQVILDEDIIRRIEAKRGSGQPLEPEVRSQMEGAFGHEFSDVQIHTNASADGLAKDLRAKAFTLGKDVFFREGAYQPNSEAGKGLLAHELTHVVQQESGAEGSQISIGQGGDAFEQEATGVGQALTKGHEVSVRMISAVPRLQRQKTAAEGKEEVPASPPPGAYPLTAGANPTNIIDYIADISKEAIAQRITTTQAGIKNFETNILLKSDDPKGDVLSVIIYNLFVFVIKDGIDKVTAAIPAARAVGMVKKIAETFVEYSSKVKAAEGKDALRKFILDFRTVTLSKLLDDKKQLVLDLKPELGKKFDEYAEGSPTPYRRTQKEPWVAGPQAWFLRREENRAKEALASVKPIPAVEMQILQDWMRGSTEKVKGGLVSPFAEELLNGYLDIGYFISRDWYGTKEGEPPKRVKEAKLDDAFLHCASSGDVLKRLKEIMKPWNVWDIKVPKRVVIIETPVYPEADGYLEFDADNKVVQKKDKYNAWGVVFKIPIPPDKVKAG
jgi:hypothetical protein